jgi:hypothetical protein
MSAQKQVQLHCARRTPRDADATQGGMQKRCTVHAEDRGQRTEYRVLNPLWSNTKPSHHPNKWGPPLPLTNSPNTTTSRTPR